jgi:hypothetical protein
MTEQGWWVGRGWQQQPGAVVAVEVVERRDSGGSGRSAVEGEWLWEHGRLQGRRCSV